MRPEGSCHRHQSATVQGLSPRNCRKRQMPTSPASRLRQIPLREMSTGRHQVPPRQITRPPHRGGGSKPRFCNLSPASCTASLIAPQSLQLPTQRGRSPEACAHSAESTTPVKDLKFEFRLNHFPLGRGKHTNNHVWIISILHVPFIRSSKEKI